MKRLLRALGQGDSFVITRNGVPVGRLTPIARRTFVPIDEVGAAFAHLAPIDYAQFRADIDAHIDQDITPVSRERGMLDTPVVIDLMTIERERLPLEETIAALTIAELTAGPIETSDAVERAQRLERSQQTEALLRRFCSTAPQHMHMPASTPQRCWRTKNHAAPEPSIC